MFNLIDAGTGVKLKREQELDVCINCLDKLNYILTTRYREENLTAVKSFDLDEYFIRFACSPITVTPLETDRTAPLSVYSKDWKQTSKEFKEGAKWHCEGCGGDFGGNKSKFLQSHHRDGNISDDRHSNIKVLCIICHGKEPHHGQLKASPLYKEYRRNFL